MIFLLATGTATGTGRRPLDAETAELLPSGAVEVEMGLAGAEDAERPLFPGFKGTALTLPVVGLRTGLGSWGELRVEGDVLRRFDPDEGGTVRGAGDWRVHTKVRVGRHDRRIRWAALFGVKIPVASDNEGLGTNLADIEARALLGLTAGTWHFDLDAGIAILGAPFRERAQVDLAIYAVAARREVGSGWEIVGEIAGREGGDFTPARSVLRLGARARRQVWRFDGALAVGLADASPSAEIRLGATLRLDRGPRGATARSAPIPEGP